MYSKIFTVPANIHSTFPGTVRYTLPAVKCIYSHRFITNLRCRVHYMVQASRSRHFMQQTKQNTNITTLKPKTIHCHINQYCVWRLYRCVCVCVRACWRESVCIYVHIYVYVYIPLIPHNYVAISMANSKCHGGAVYYMMIVYGDNILTLRCCSW
jgi:hypothetical protein